MEQLNNNPDFQISPEQKEEIERLQEILQEMQDAGLPVDPKDATSVVGWKIWEMGIKNAEGELESRVMRSVQLQPSAQDLHSSLIREAPPIMIKPAKLSRSKGKDKRAIIIPDLQGGFRRHGEDDLEPIHDENVVDVGLQIIRHAQPDLILLNGDNLDFPELSRFAPDSNGFQMTMQATIDRVSELMGQIRSNAPDAKIVWLEGNHEYRLRREILKHNAALWGIKRPGEDFNWLSVASLMKLDHPDLDITYVSGYPANSFLINDRLQVTHGDKARNGSTAPAVANSEELSTIYGHVHRHESWTRTNRLGRQITAMSFGTWARTDGAVPSYGNGVDDEGRVVPRMENWQNGLGFVEYREGDSPFQEHHIRINSADNYKTRFDGHTFKPNGTRTT